MLVGVSSSLNLGGRTVLRQRGLTGNKKGANDSVGGRGRVLLLLGVVVELVGLVLLAREVGEGVRHPRVRALADVLLKKKNPEIRLSTLIRYSWQISQGRFYGFLTGYVGVLISQSLII